MLQIVKQTKAEKMAMYMKMSKRKLVEIILGHIDVIDKLKKNLDK